MTVDADSVIVELARLTWTQSELEVIESGWHHVAFLKMSPGDYAILLKEAFLKMSPGDYAILLKEVEFRRPPNEKSMPGHQPPYRMMIEVDKDVPDGVCIPLDANRRPILLAIPTRTPRGDR